MESNVGMSDLHSSIINYLNNMMKNKDEKNIQRIYNICSTISNNEEINKIFNKKKYDKRTRSFLLNKLEEYNASDCFIKQINNPIDYNSLPLYGNIYNYVNKDYLNFWKDIASESTLKNGKGVGPYEIFLTILLRGAEKSYMGDVCIDNYNIEVKSTEGRCTPNGLKVNPKCINDFLNKELRVEDAIITNGKKNIENTFKKYKDRITPEILGKAIFSQWKDILGSKSKSVESEWMKFINTVELSGDFSYVVLKLIGVLNIYCYKILSDWQSIIIIKKNGRGDNKEYTGEYIIIKDDDITFEKMFDNKKLIIHSHPSAKDTISYYVQLDCDIIK